ncbi:MAG: histidine kinase N-terminal 7TM domain-containing protein [Candidatus Thermoplasmatota archaeon]|nr:histidine kinase N-terminal 7TM domain-containing protein [Candidatus Thermoplasmatota archaeon]
MNLETILFVGPLIASGLLTLLLAGLMLKKERSQNTLWFSILMIVVSIWSLSYALEIVLLDEGLTLFFYKIKYVGITATPLAWFFFSISYTKKEFMITKKIILIASIIPVLTISMLFSNSLHHLFWSEISFIGNTHLLMVFGKSAIFFLIHTFYSYLLIVLGTGLFITTLFQTKDIFTKQNLAVLLAVLFPIIGNIVVVFNLITFPYGYDITPLLFMISGVVFCFAIIYFKFLELLPAARDEIFDNFTQGIFVLNKNMLFVDWNNAADSLLKQGYFSTSFEHIVGSPIDILFEKIFPNGVLNEVGIDSSTVEMQGKMGKKWFEVSMNPLSDKRNNLKGHVISFDDVTKQIQTEEKLIEKITELERFKQVTIDRELKMIELKKRIEQLEKTKEEMN